MSDKKMKPARLAECIFKYVDSLDDMWDELKATVLKQLAIVTARAKELYQDILESEDKFYQTIAELILMMAGVKTGIKKRALKWILMLILKKVIDPILDKKIGPDWLEQIKKRSYFITIANGKVVDSYDNNKPV